MWVCSPPTGKHLDIPSLTLLLFYLTSPARCHCENLILTLEINKSFGPKWRLRLRNKTSAVKYNLSVLRWGSPHLHLAALPCRDAPQRITESSFSIVTSGVAFPEREEIIYTTKIQTQNSAGKNRKTSHGSKYEAGPCLCVEALAVNEVWRPMLRTV